ncbi:MAG: hypothetical protein OEV27_01925 [Nitrospira sp.]|nr:hypothetical protein [Nitrospira sp.]MDH4249919.1 hypothetical protein [Nitrospira sp.]MDH5336605.1 hypothetical protein [Nitrospira sp.]
MRRDTSQRKRALAGMKALAGQEEMLGTLLRVISAGKQALDAVMREMGRLVAESIMLMEREEAAGPDYYPPTRRSRSGRMRRALCILAIRRSP